MSKYENSVLPSSLHSTVNLPAWRPKDTNITLMSFLRLFTETITTERAFFQNYMTNSVKIDEILEKLPTTHFVIFRNVLLKYELRIKDKELHDKEQIIYTNFF